MTPAKIVGIVLVLMLALMSGEWALRRKAGLA